MTSQILSTVPPESEEGMTLSGGGQDLRPQTSLPTGQTDPRELFSRGRQELETREGMWGPQARGWGSQHIANGQTADWTVPEPHGTLLPAASRPGCLMPPTP